MVKLDKKLCPVKGCFTSASYGIVGQKRKYCAAHAERGMTSIGGRRCSDEECSKRANYGVPGTRKREYCAEHAKAGMVNINNQKTNPKTDNTSPATGISSPSELVSNSGGNDDGVRSGPERPSSAPAAEDAKGTGDDHGDCSSSDVTSNDAVDDCQVSDRSHSSSGDQYAASAATAQGSGGMRALIEAALLKEGLTAAGNSGSCSGSGSGSCTGSGGEVGTREGEHGFGAAHIATVEPVPGIREGHTGIISPATASFRCSTAGGAVTAGMAKKYHPSFAVGTAVSSQQHKTRKAKIMSRGLLEEAEGSSSSSPSSGSSSINNSSSASSSSSSSSDGNTTSPKRSTVMLPWPNNKDSPPPLLLTSSGWSSWDWQQVKMT